MDHRSQYVQLGSFKSCPRTPTCGIPQGSSLGPIAFLIYINDIAKCINNGSVKLFADDTTIFYDNCDSKALKKLIENDLKRLSTWFKNNKLTLNMNKCTFMTFRSVHKKYEQYDLEIEGVKLSQVESFKYLGVHLDCNLSWKTHINNVCNKVSAIGGILYKINSIVPLNTLCSIYYTLCHPHLLYCIEAWGSAYESNIIPLYRLQKRAVRNICSVDHMTHSEPLFKMLGILPLRKLYFFRVCLSVFKELKNISKMPYGFKYSSDRRGRSGTNQLYVPTVNTNYGFQCISCTGPRFYNVLPEPIKNIPTFLTFKNVLKKWILVQNIDIADFIIPRF